jgi:uncharacterized protein (DUF2249 family)
LTFPDVNAADAAIPAVATSRRTDQERSMHDPRPALPQVHAHGGCTCGEHDDDTPVLDARLIPHAIRHASIMGAMDSLRSGAALVLVAPHDPQPLLAQLRARYPEGIDVEYLQRGPDTWHIRLQRR